MVKNHVTILRYRLQSYLAPLSGQKGRGIVPQVQQLFLNDSNPVVILVWVHCSCGSVAPGLKKKLDPNFFQTRNTGT